MNYTVPSQNLFYAYQPISLRPLALQQDTNLYLGIRNYIKVGYGNYSTPYVNAGFSFGDGNNDSPFSVSAWVKVGTLQNFRILAKYDANTNTEWSFGTDGQGRLLMLVTDGANLKGQRYASFTDNNGGWQHVVGTYNGVGGNSAQSGLKVYVDGVEVQDTAVSIGGAYVAMSNTTQNLNIGRILLGASTEYLDGNMADVRLYDAELSSSDVSDLYAGTNITTNLVGQWLTDADNVLDNAGSNNGTNYGSKYSYDNPSPSVEFGSASRFFDGGIAQYVSLPDSATFPTGAQTNSCWIKPRTTRSGGSDILGKWGNAGNLSFLLYYLSNQLRVYSNNVLQANIDTKNNEEFLISMNN